MTLFVYERWYNLCKRQQIGGKNMELSMEMKKDIEKEINCIIEETTQYDFPLFATQDKKKAIIMDKKLYIEEKLKRILPDTFPNEDTVKKMWEESIEYSDEQFESLSEKHKLNGFYLQELIHCYAEKIGKAILENI